MLDACYATLLEFNMVLAIFKKFFTFIIIYLNMLSRYNTSLKNSPLDPLNPVLLLRELGGWVKWKWESS